MAATNGTETTASGSVTVDPRWKAVLLDFLERAGWSAGQAFVATLLVGGASVSAGFSAGQLPPNEPTSATELQLDLAVSDTDGFLARVAYYLDLIVTPTQIATAPSVS